MKKKIIITALIVLFAITSTIGGALAATGLQEIKAHLNHDITIVLHGKEWSPPSAPITYNWTTYLPLRAVAEAAGLSVGWDSATQTITLSDADAPSEPTQTYDEILYFPAYEYPQTAAHIASAILAGESAICTIDRRGADDNRSKSLAGIPTRDGYDRDEWPMAMCAEGGAGASVAYIEPSDNRGAGSFVGNALEQYPDGTRVKFIVTFDENAGKAAADVAVDYSGPFDPLGADRNCGDFANWSEAQAFFVAAGGPDSDRHRLDADGNGIACEGLR